jgi:Flp pilus assembly protein TadG
MTARKEGGYWKNENGASAAEFTLVLIPFLALVFGIVSLCMMFYANHTLQYAAEAAARCASVGRFTNCTNTTAVQNYALSHYSGPNITPVFVATTAGCGHTVTGTASFPLNAIVINIAVPLSATACFP